MKKVLVVACLAVLASHAAAGRLIDERALQSNEAAQGNEAVQVNVSLEGKAESVKAAAAPGPTELRLEAGQPLSRALRALLDANGWSMAWQLDYDYFLDAPLVFAPADLKTIVDRVVSIYQQHGGLIGVRARFAADNKVVVFEEVDHAR